MALAQAFGMGFLTTVKNIAAAVENSHVHGVDLDAEIEMAGLQGVACGL